MVTPIFKLSYWHDSTWKKTHRERVFEPRSAGSEADALPQGHRGHWASLAIGGTAGIQTMPSVCFVVFVVHSIGGLV